MKRLMLLFLLISFIINLHLSAQNSEKQKQWSNFEKDFPGENIVKWMPKTNAPKRIIGNNIFIPVKSIQKNNVAKHAEDFLNRYQSLFNFRGSNLKYKDASEFDNCYLVVFQQYYKNIEVMNAMLKLKITYEGQVTWINSQCLQDIQISEKPSISFEDAQNIALARHNIENNESKGDGKLVIFLNPETNNLSLCWNLLLTNKQQDLNKILLIDAKSGKLVLEYDSFLSEGINGNVKIKTWTLPGMEAGSPNLIPNCQDLKVTVTGVGSSNTDQNGNYSITVPSSGNYVITSVLDGVHAYVENDPTGSEDSYSATVSTSTDHNWTWQNSTHYNEYFVFYYMNNGWHEFSNDVPGFSSNYWNTNKMLGIANDGTGVDGSANGIRITITEDNHYGGSVYHEYAHNVNNRARGGWIGWPYAFSDGYAMDEGFADYFSCSFRNDSYRYASDRDLGTKMKYYSPGPPEDAAHEGHTRGQIIGGACWDLRNKSGMDISYVNGKVYQVIAGLGSLDTFGDFFDDLLLADDDDGNIFNGTPHDDEIFDAFINDHAIAGSYLAGNINTNISLIYDVVLLEDINIGNGSTITIKNGMTLDLNGYSIIVTNGQIIEETGATINGLRAIRNDASNVIKGYYSLIQTSINDSQVGDEIRIEPGTFNENISISNKNYWNIIGNATSTTPTTIINGDLNIYNTDNVIIYDIKVNGTVDISYSDVELTFVECENMETDFSTLDMYDVTVKDASNYGISIFDTDINGDLVLLQ